MRVGRNRRPRIIQEALDSLKPHGKCLADVARALNLSRTIVSNTARGLANNRSVLRGFLDIGVSPEALDLPPDLLGYEPKEFNWEGEESEEEVA